MGPQKVAQLVGITPNEVEVTSSSPPPPSYADMSKKKKTRMSFNIIGEA
jgi:hypothetical protein